MAELDAEVKNSLRAIQTTVESLTKAQTRLNDQMRQYGQDARAAFRNSGLENVKKHTEDTGKAMHELGHAVRYLGGPLGEIAHKLTGGAGMEGGFGKIAIAAGAASLAVEALSAVMERHAEEARKAAEADEQWRETLEKGESAALKQAQAGLQQAAARRKLLGAGGQEAVDAASTLKKSLAGVSSADDVEGGVAAIYARYGAGPRARATAELARTLAQLGGGYSESANALLAAGGAVELPGVGRKVAARVYAQKTGRTNANPDDVFSNALAATFSDPLLEAAGEAGRTANTSRESLTDKAIKDGPNAARHEAAANADPLLAAILEAHNRSERHLATLARKAQEEGGTWWGSFIGALKDDFTPGGSANTQYTRALRIQSEAELRATGAGRPGSAYAPGE